MGWDGADTVTLAGLGATVLFVDPNPLTGVDAGMYCAHQRVTQFSLSASWTLRTGTGKDLPVHNCVDSNNNIGPAADYDFTSCTLWQTDDSGRVVPAAGTSGDTVTRLEDDALLIGNAPSGAAGYGGSYGSIP
jgi:hypothetical protein